MELIQIIVLALIQGITEFLPISSSAHLILTSKLLHWKDQNYYFDVAVHAGSLLAILIYLRKDIKIMLIAWFKSLNKQHSKESNLAWLIILATIPTVITGAIMASSISSLRSTYVIAATSIIFGIALYIADQKKSNIQDMYALTWKQAVLIGLAQTLALIPGTSRSGVTITAALLLGFSKTSSAKISFLLSIPIIVAATSYTTIKGIKYAEVPAAQEVILGMLISFITALTFVHLFIKMINKIGMTPFVIYRIVLGLLLFLI